MYNNIIKEIENQDIAIVGFGKEGMSSYNFIRRHLPNKHLTIIDGNSSLVDNNLYLKEDNNLSFELGSDYLNNLEKYDVIIKSPGVKFKDIDIENFKSKITSQIEFILKYFSKNIIGVTASKGKSTTSSLIYKILIDQGYDARLLGNIGNPIFDDIETFNDNTILVIEMAALQLEFVNYSPHIGLILNLFEEHLDFFKTKNHYYLSKMNMFKYQNTDDYSIYLSSNETLNEYIKVGNYKSILVDIEKELSIIDNCVVYKDKKLYDITSNRLLLGSHNLINIRFALFVSEILDLDINKTIDSINTFAPLEHRLECVGTYNGVTYYNDSIATIPTATINAIEGLGNVNTLIFGGMDRGIDYSEFIEYLKKCNVENLICMPSTGYKIGEHLKDSNKNIYFIESLEDAVKKGKEITKKDTICLLSPAASSYEYFKNFEEKGTAYKKFVREN